jgi:hypothetical protein
LLISIARGQKQTEDLTGWLNQDFAGVDSLMAPFKKFYGLDQGPSSKTKYVELWSKQLKSFQDSFQEYL